ADGSVGAIAGSTLTMGEAVRRAVTEVGMSPSEAVQAAGLVPLRALGLTAGQAAGPTDGSAGRSGNGPAGRSGNGPAGRPEDGPAGRSGNGPAGRSGNGPAGRPEDGPAPGNDGPAALLAPGMPADLLLLDRDMSIRRTWYSH